MVKQQVSKTQLEQDFLAKLQAKPDCAGVTAVVVRSGTRLGSTERWKVVDWKGEADDDAVEEGLRAVYKELDGTVEMTE